MIEPQKTDEAHPTSNGQNTEEAELNFETRRDGDLNIEVSRDGKKHFAVLATVEKDILDFADED
ncbi:MAG: hypothetical protein AAFV95_17815 [Bacteroidota bacterium]